MVISGTWRRGKKERKGEGKREEGRREKEKERKGEGKREEGRREKEKESVWRDRGPPRTSKDDAKEHTAEGSPHSPFKRKERKDTNLTIAPPCGVKNCISFLSPDLMIAVYL